MGASRLCFILTGVLMATFAGVPSGVRAQVPPPPPAPGQDAVAGQEPGVEVLTRGQVHEAFAATTEFPVAGPVVPKAPPQPIEEMPPDQRPAGPNVQWLPGYWHWDEERNDYIWICGFWRVSPPGKVWVPGSWREVPCGVQWAAGFWQASFKSQTALELLPPPPPPPASSEVAISRPPTPTSVYVPGTYVWQGRYVWQPGNWVEYLPGLVWVPAHFRRAPEGYVFVEGYWDYPLDARGVLYAPVAFDQGVCTRPGYVYTPVYAVSPSCMYGAMFVRRGYGTYYFGDYFDSQYATAGYTAWCGSANEATFTVSIDVGPGLSYDPLWGYYRVAYRTDPEWAAAVGNVYAGRYRGDIPRPPRTIAQQTTIIGNITQVNVTHAAVVNTVMVAPVKTIQRTNTTLVLTPVKREEAVYEAARVREARAAAVQRQQAAMTWTTGASPPTSGPSAVKAAVPHGPLAVKAVGSHAAPAGKPSILHAVAARTRMIVPGAKRAPPHATEAHKGSHEHPSLAEMGGRVLLHLLAKGAVAALDAMAHEHEYEHEKEHEKHHEKK
ncbi:YXWGXW repeat-containing protein [Fimbriiglobus ruber]|uniref:Lipoprotein n=1 Tax=Fimbriiglobus ruber TaxID=1908690 RepID=A0A225DXE4_9BACT|nr:YXWGXW repeat-containing protein [Fimbriiglobus ruber]OWK41889.1 hypothetical protein FRUB_03967 [Fimbriiglobus ruber]